MLIYQRVCRRLVDPLVTSNRILSEAWRGPRKGGCLGEASSERSQMRRYRVGLTWFNQETWGLNGFHHQNYSTLGVSTSKDECNQQRLRGLSIKNSGVNGNYWDSISPRFAVPMGRREHQVIRPAAELVRSSMVQRNPGSAPFCSHQDSWQWLIWMFIPPKYGISMYFKGFDPHNGAIRLKSNDVAELGSTRAKHTRDLLKKHGSTFQST